MPVFYAYDYMVIASFDAVFLNAYLQQTGDALKNTKKYLKEQGTNQIKVEEVKGNYLVNSKDIYNTKAYKITFEQ